MNSSRRNWLQATACGFGHTALLAMLHQQAGGRDTAVSAAPLTQK